jgi:hypothetical protein
MLFKVMSGGQTGVDQTALKCAKTLGLQTGGWAPLGWRTEDGPAPWLQAEYGCQEHRSPLYPPRTEANVRDADATVWFGKVSPGFWCTKNAAMRLGKKFFPNPPEGLFLELCQEYGVLNFAGNRMGTNPQASGVTEARFAALGHMLNATQEAAHGVVQTPVTMSTAGEGVGAPSLASPLDVEPRMSMLRQWLQAHGQSVETFSTGTELQVAFYGGSHA